MLQLARVTPATMDVLRELVAASEALWGLRLVVLTGRPAGSVYPILARLEAGGWVASRWEDSAERGPRRRFYELTGEGRASAAALVEQARPALEVSRAPAPAPAPAPARVGAVAGLS